jgi:hypothetical protein
MLKSPTGMPTCEVTYEKRNKLDLEAKLHVQVRTTKGRLLKGPYMTFSELTELWVAARRVIQETA